MNADNDRRAERGQATFDFYAGISGESAELAANDLAATLGDLIADLMYGFGEELVGDAWELAVQHHEAGVTS